MKRGSKTDDILSLLFMLLAVAAGICFFSAGRTVFYILGSLAVIMRIVQYILRFF
jgi:hypothetical protein